MIKNKTIPVLAVLAFVPAVALANGMTGVTFEGSGCSGGSVGHSMSSDGSRATMIFDTFVATQGPNIDVSEEVKTCSVTFSLAGSDATGVKMIARGYVQLPAGMTTKQHQHIISVKQGNTVAGFDGPIARDYVTVTQGTLRDRHGDSASFTIQLQLEVDGATGTAIGQATIDSLDIELAP